jgi:hypothetical protein
MFSQTSEKPTQLLCGSYRLAKILRHKGARFRAQRPLPLELLRLLDTYPSFRSK